MRHSDAIRYRPRTRAEFLAEVSADTMLPSQLQPRHAQVAWTPERHLLLAVLQDAVDIVRKVPGAHVHPKALQLRVDTLAWFAGAPARVPFAYVCAVLGMDESYARRCVRAQVGTLPRDLSRTRHQRLADRGRRHRRVATRARAYPNGRPMSIVPENT